MSKSKPAYDVVEVYICPHCEEAFEWFGGPVYECSRCGGTEVVEEGERGRCGSCNIFMAKQAPQSCPDCEEGIDETLEPVQRIQTPDGETHETMEAAKQWVRDAPKRAKEAALAKLERDRVLDEYRKQSEERKAHRRSVVARWKPIEYYGGKRDDSMYWDSSTVSLTMAEFLDLLGEEDVIAALREAHVVQQAYLDEKKPRQAWVLPRVDYIDEIDDEESKAWEIDHLRRQRQFVMDFEVFERLVDRNLANR